MNDRATEFLKLCKERCKILEETAEEVFKEDVNLNMPISIVTPNHRRSTNFFLFIIFSIIMIAIAAIGYFGVYSWNKASEKYKKPLAVTAIIIGIILGILGLFVLFSIYRELFQC